jgi:hypothetical protein
MSALDITALPAPGLQTIGHSHARRVRIVLLLGSSASILIGVPWAAFFALRGDWVVALSDCAVSLAGAVAVQMTRNNKLRGACIVLVGSLFVRLVGLATVFDLPSLEVPRCVHNYLVPLGLSAYLMLKHENAWLRDGLAWGCLATVVFLTSSDFGFATGHGIPHSIRAAGNWIHNTSAMALMFLLLHIFVADIDHLEARLHRMRRWWISQVGHVLPAGWNRRLTRFSDSVKPLIPGNVVAITPAATRGWLLTRVHRVQLLVLASSAMLIIFGTLFAVYFGLRGATALVVNNVAMVVLGIALAFLGGDRHQRAATFTLAAGLMLIFLVTSAFIDIPTAQVPRATHYWFLPLSLGAYFLLRDENAWVHLGLPIAGLVAFVALASSGWGIATPYVLPEIDRPPPWLVSGSALAALYLLVHILVGDIHGLEVWMQGTLGRFSAQYRAN